MRTAKLAEKGKHTGDELVGEHATSCRAMAARANDLAVDRPDISLSTKELCRCFAHPNGDAIHALKRLVTYLIGCPRLVWDFVFHPQCNKLLTLIDTDVAKCLSTRRNTSGGAAMRGCNLIEHRSVTHGTVTLSSAEAGLGGITKGASTNMGLISVAADLGVSWTLALQTD